LAYSIRVIPDVDTLGVIPNLLTSNGDGKNDFLSLEKILPFDNCFFNFDFVEIYNRWGKPVFNSSNRNFKWQPEADKDGIYFYALHFKEKSFTSWLAVVR
ncbi:MAG TPA: gliding motility-associated C-terminal domain-containing protein, partial [Catalimonadaceae bacterium]|nr:gliding motility-associated C-terminal domain-containing protein [Catalimonadaceae bacterium]